MSLQKIIKKFIIKYRFYLITLFISLILSIFYQYNFVNKLYAVDIILKKNDDLIYKIVTKNHTAALNSHSDFNKKLSDKQVFMGHVNVYLENGMNIFNSITTYEANKNIHLLEIKKLCLNLKIISLVRYISVKCITDNPLKIEKLVIKNLDNIWSEIYHQYPLKIYSDEFFNNSNELDSGNLLIKINSKISEKNNRFKNIIKFNLIILFIILVTATRKYKIKS